MLIYVDRHDSAKYFGEDRGAGVENPAQPRVQVSLVFFHSGVVLVPTAPTQENAGICQVHGVRGRCLPDVWKGAVRHHLCGRAVRSSTGALVD